MNIIDRIKKYEKIYDELTLNLEKIKNDKRIRKEYYFKINELKTYYENEWMDDFKKDELGLLPYDLKRGILSEDAIYDLLMELER